MPLPAAEYECHTCGQIFSLEQFEKDNFCPKCEMRLWPKFITKPKLPTGQGTFIEPIDPPPEVNLATIFAEFNRLTNFDCGEGDLIKNMPSWIIDRRGAYNEFRGRLSQNRLVSLEKLCEDYLQFLRFENNHSWTTLPRRGSEATSDPKRLWKLVVYIQDESVPIKQRINNALEGQYYVYGIGKNILTGLLHMFYPDKYGVWNNRSVETLNLIRRKPLPIAGVGDKYLAINRELKRLSNELETDLTTIDGLMWYVSKRLKSQLIS